jgi:Arabinose efflux permease
MHNSSIAQPEAKAPLWTRDYCLLLLANLCLCFGFYVMPPILPAYVLRSGGSALEASLVVGLFSIFALVFRVLGGGAADSRGPKRIALAGTLVVLASTLSFPFLSVGGLLVARIVEGIGWGLGTAALATAISAAVAPSRRGEGIGYYSLTTILALGITPLVAIPAMNTAGFPSVAAASAALLAAGIICVLLASDSGPSRAASPSRRGLGWKTLFEPRALLPSVLCFLLTVTVCGIITFIMLYGEEIRFGGISFFFVGFTAMALATRPLAGRIFDRRGHFVLVVPGTLCMLAGLALLSFARSMPLLVVSSLFFGLGYGAVQPSLQAWNIARAPEDRRGAANGTYLSSMDLSYTLGSMALGSIAHATSYAFMYRISCLFLVALLVVYLAASRRALE